MVTRAELVFREAVDEVIAEHARPGLPPNMRRNGTRTCIPGNGTNVVAPIARKCHSYFIPHG
jgi:hypothetical protein